MGNRLSAGRRAAKIPPPTEDTGLFSSRGTGIYATADIFAGGSCQLVASSAGTRGKGAFPPAVQPGGTIEDTAAY